MVLLDFTVLGTVILCVCHALVNGHLSLQAPTPQNGSNTLNQFVGCCCLIVCYHFVGLALKWLNSKFALTHFKPLVSFYTPWKHQITHGLLMFLGDKRSVAWVGKYVHDLTRTIFPSDNFCTPRLRSELFNSNIFQRYLVTGIILIILIK